jgi:ATPase subunit of ABC transporter with duplicated ATPase domains
VLRAVSVFLYPGTKVAIVGDNGAGKTTLLQCLLGTLQPDSGTRVVAPGCRIAYVSQHHADDLMKQCLDSTEGAASMLARLYHVDELTARSRLGKFGISGNVATMPMKALSGGQRVRVSLASITWDSPEVLLLDEPTNHCDMSALDALASALNEFTGAVAIVSHNRSFLTSCCSELWIVEKHTLRRERPPPGDETRESFANLFEEYSSRVLSNHGGTGGIRVGGSSGALSKASRAALAHDNSSSASNTKRGGSGSKRRGKEVKSGGAADRTAMF